MTPSKLILDRHLHLRLDAKLLESLNASALKNRLNTSSYCRLILASHLNDSSSDFHR